jgi:hypothetical protein
MGLSSHRLPVELKNYIFELLLPSRDEWGEFLAFERPKDPVMPSYLTSVCRGWRDIAWSNPLLWSTMHIALEHEPRHLIIESNQFRARLDPALSDLASHSSHRCPRQGGSEEELKTVIDAISQCSNRWHSLSLDIPLSCYAPFFTVTSSVVF